MSLTPEQQLFESVNRAKRILVLGKTDSDIATISSVLALATFLEKRNKHVDIVIPGFKQDFIPAFLISEKKISPTLGPLRVVKIKINTAHSSLEEIISDVTENSHTVTLIPKQGEWSTQDISFHHGEDIYDLIITIDCPDLISLGEIARDHADLIYRIPLCNIDTSASNEYWGQINIVDFTAVSSGELLYRLFCQWDRLAIDEKLATLLLTNMIAKTRSFRTAHVTPKTLQASSELMSLGAKREDIVHGLWRNKSVPMLRLWGKVLTRLEQDVTRGLVWAVLTRSDLIDSGVHEIALDGIVDELLAYAPEAKVIALIHEALNSNENTVHTNIYATPPHSALELCRTFTAQGSREHATFSLSGTTSLVENSLNIIKSIQDAMDTSSN